MESLWSLTLEITASSSSEKEKKKKKKKIYFCILSLHLSFLQFFCLVKEMEVRE